MDNIKEIEGSPSTDQIIVLKSVYKIPKMKIQPTRDKTTNRFLGVPELSPKQKEGLAYYATPDDMIEIYDGKTFDLSKEEDRIIWDWVKYSPRIGASREAIDSSRDKEFYVHIEGIESAKKVKRRDMVHEAVSFIKKDSQADHYKRAKLLGNRMDQMPHIEVIEYLYNVAESTPHKIISLYTDGNMKTKLLLLDAMEARIIYQDSGIYRYGDTEILGTTEEQAVIWLQSADNKNLVDMIKKQLYPEYYKTEEKSTKSTKSTTKTTKSTK